MDDGALTLAHWLSPAFPTGAFAYSHGLEQAVAEGRVGDASTLRDWLADVLVVGGGWSDAVIAACARRGTGADIPTLDAEVLAFAASAGRRRETLDQGMAFATTAAALIGDWGHWGHDGTRAPRTLPVAVGRAAARLGVGCDSAIALMLQSFIANLVAAAQRLAPIGQTDGQGVVHNLRPAIRHTAARAAHATLDDLSSSAFLSDIASLRHETLEPRIFRT